MKIITILGVKLNPITRTEAAAFIKKYLNEEKTRIVVTPGPEFLVRAQKQPHFKALLNNADLSLADGSGLVFLSGGKIPERCSGADILAVILKEVYEKNLRLGIVLRKDGLTSEQQLRDSLKNAYPGMSTKIVFKAVDQEMDTKNLAIMKKFTPQALLVALGAPEQEEWIFRHKNEFPQARLMIGIGGALDYLSGRLRRAPRIIQKIGLEWLWRLIRQPRRLPRILNAVILFPLLIIKERLFKPAP